MANVTNVWLIAGTGTGGDDGSSNSLELEINVGTSDDVELETNSSTRTARWGSKSDPGDAAIWQWDQSFWSGNFTPDDVDRVDLEIEGDDKWLPSNIFVVFEDDAGGYSLKGSNGAWPSDQCFSEDDSDCGGDAQKTWNLYTENTDS